ncbi:hypothetical protein M407DRAFT_78180, partial [Tulasnella calospora MUT 4182]
SCCSGSYSTPQTCPPTGVPNYQYFKSSCPNSHVYAHDESSGTALFPCPSSKNANCELLSESHLTDLGHSIAVNALPLISDNITFCPAP